MEAKNAFHNDELWKWVSQDDRASRAIIVDGRILQKSNPIHRYDLEESGFQATMYAPFKRLGFWILPTWHFNVLVLIAMSFMVWGILLMNPAQLGNHIRSFINRVKSPQQV